MNEVKALAKKAVAAGYWNIDIDTSTLVTLAPPSLDEQQRENYLRSAMLTKFIRDLEPEGVTISLGGEIGEVGEKNSTVPELDAYIHGYKVAPGRFGRLRRAEQDQWSPRAQPTAEFCCRTAARPRWRWISIRCETWASAPAFMVPAARSSMAPARCRMKCSTTFPRRRRLRFHLATGFTSTFLDHPSLPESLRQEMYVHLDAHHADERGANDSDFVFHLKTRKKALGAVQTGAVGAAARAGGGDLRRCRRSLRLLL